MSEKFNASAEQIQPSVDKQVELVDKKIKTLEGLVESATDEAKKLELMEKLEVEYEKKAKLQVKTEEGRAELKEEVEEAVKEAKQPGKLDKLKLQIGAGALAALAALGGGMAIMGGGEKAVDTSGGEKVENVEEQKITSQNIEFSDEYNLKWGVTYWEDKFPYQKEKNDEYLRFGKKITDKRGQEMDKQMLQFLALRVQNMPLKEAIVQAQKDTLTDYEKQLMAQYPGARVVYNVDLYKAIVANTNLTAEQLDEIATETRIDDEIFGYVDLDQAR